MSKGSSSKGGSGDDRITNFISTKSINPFASNDLLTMSKEPLKFNPPSGGTAYGYEATILPESIPTEAAQEWYEVEYFPWYAWKAYADNGKTIWHTRDAWDTVNDPDREGCEWGPEQFPTFAEAEEEGTELKVCDSNPVTHFRVVRVTVTREIV